MNAREALKQVAGFNSENSYGKPLTEIDELTRELMEWAVSYIEPLSGEHLEHHPIKNLVDKGRSLGYGDK